MVIKAIARAFWLGMLLLLASCGGGGGGSTPTTPPSGSNPATLGTFVDAPVSGVAYTTSSGMSGTTDQNGQFKFAVGDTVTFSAAGVTLGSFQPNVASDGTAIVTPLNLVGASSVTDPKATAIGQFLSTLNALSIAQGAGKSGIFVVPSGTALQKQLASLNTTAPNLTAAQLQAALDAVFGAGKFTVVPAATAQAALQQGINAQSLIGSIWTGACTCGGGGIVYFQPNGTLVGFTLPGGTASRSHTLSGSWSANSAATGGGVSMSILSSDGAYSKNAFIAAGASTGTGEIWNNNVLQGTFTFSKLTGSSPTPSLYTGGWYATYTPNAAGIAQGDKGGSAFGFAAADGSLRFLTESGDLIAGTWNPSTGQGTGSLTDKSGTVTTVTVDFSTGSGSVSRGGTVMGNVTFTRNGSFTLSPPTSATGPSIPLLLNIVTSWANLPNTMNSIAVSLNVLDAGGAQLAFGTKSTSTPPNSSGVRSSTTDNIAVSYPTGAGKTYAVSVGQQNCTVANGSGTVVDANSGNANAYPTVYITCDPNATASPPIPLLLNVSTSWANTAQSVSSFALRLDVNDSSSKQIAWANKPVSEGSPSSSGVRSTTTDNIAASYTKGLGASYQLSIPPGQPAATQCSLTGGASGTVVDANSGNAAAYPTVTVVCN